jgi:type II secretory pathway predicted ATPase ExeA
MDQNSSGLSILFGCAPEVWQDVMGEYHAFSERIGNEVALQPLTAEHLEDLVQSYLNTARRGETERIEPFAADSLDVILQRSQGNIRQVLSMCGRAIDTGIEQESRIITPEIVQQTFD